MLPIIVAGLCHGLSVAHSASGIGNYFPENPDCEVLLELFHRTEAVLAKNKLPGG